MVSRKDGRSIETHPGPPHHRVGHRAGSHSVKSNASHHACDVCTELRGDDFSGIDGMTEWRAGRPVPQALGGSCLRPEVVCRSTGRHAEAAPTGVTVTRAWPGALRLIERPGSEERSRSALRLPLASAERWTVLPGRRSLIDAIRSVSVRNRDRKSES